MQIRYIREPNFQYLALTLRKYTQQDYRIAMLLENEIDGILPVHMQSTDGIAELCFDITSCNAISDNYSSGKMSIDEISELLLWMNHVLDALTGFLLNGNGLILNPEFIFCKNGTKRLYFCYDPFAEDSAREGLMKLSQFIVDHVDYADAQTTELAYRLFQESTKETASVREFARIAMEKEKERTEQNQEEVEFGSEAKLGNPSELCSESRSDFKREEEYMQKESRDSSTILAGNEKKTISSFLNGYTGKKEKQKKGGEKEKRTICYGKDLFWKKIEIIFILAVEILLFFGMAAGIFSIGRRLFQSGYYLLGAGLLSSFILLAVGVILHRIIQDL